MNRELTVTLTERTVFIFTLRTLVKQPLEIKLNGPTHWLVCAEFMLWQIEENDVKKEKKNIYNVFYKSQKQSSTIHSYVTHDGRKQFTNFFFYNLTKR